MILKSISNIVNIAKFLITIGTFIAGATLWVNSQTMKMESVIQELQDRDDQTEQILYEIQEIKSDMVTSDDLSALKKQLHTENDYIIRHIQDPIESLQKDLESFREVLDSPEYSKVVSMAHKPEIIFEPIDE